jgi:hypothetical protein
MTVTESICRLSGSIEAMDRRLSETAAVEGILQGQLERMRRDLAISRAAVASLRGDGATIDAAEATPISTAEPLRPDGNIDPALSGGKPINFAGAGSERNVPVSGGSKQQ